MISLCLVSTSSVYKSENFISI